MSILFLLFLLIIQFIKWQANKESETVTDQNLTLSDENIQSKIDKVKHNPKILAIVGMCIGLLVYFGMPIAIFFLLTGSLFIRTILVLILLYQYFFAKKSEIYRRFLLYMRPWEVFNSYTVHSEEELSTKNSLFAFHPHGALGFGAVMSAAKNEVIYNSTFCGSRALLNIPLSGIVARWMGVHGVNHKNFRDIMNRGQNIVFIPGGFEEATLTNSAKDRVFVNDRKGFIKYALEFGYKIHPCYTFNENKIFNTFNHFENFRLGLNKFKIPSAIFYSKFLIFPNTNLDLFTVIGKGIQLPIIKNPTKEDVNKYHKLYVEELTNTFNRYRNYFKASELEIL